MATVTKTVYTPEDLLAMPDSGNYELVDGELVERNLGWDSSWVVGRLHFFISTFCDAHRSGWVVPGASYQCFPDDPNKVRRAGASFIKLDRMPGDRPPKGHCRIAPNLAAEVISRNDLYSEVEAKVAEYLVAGVELVWVINPPTQSARVHRQDGTVTDLGPDDHLDGENVLPGFRCRVADLFVGP
jgi:Uma2 family endonuclease